MTRPARVFAARVALALLLAAGAACARPGQSEDPWEGLTSLGFTILEQRIDEGLGEAFVAYPSGGLSVRGWLFFDALDATPAPLLLFNHGGVSGVSGDMKWRSRELARLDDLVVFAPSYRGEDGSDGVVEVADGEVDDVLAATELLARWNRVDPERIALAGSSHGALISVLAAAREPDRFRCVVAACGVMDVVSWYHYLVENGFDVSDSLSVAVYGSGPEDKPEAFRIRQAVRVADRIPVPVLLQQGHMDRIVPVQQARLMKAALEKAENPDVLLLEYPLLGHAFWFWNDAGRHTAEEMEEAERAWTEMRGFLALWLAPGE